MKDLLSQKSTNKFEYASILAGEAWLSGILERSRNPYLDLTEPSEEQCVQFLTQFVQNCSQVLQVQEGMAMLYGVDLNITISHIDENTSSEVIANAARKASISLQNIPTYSYTKFYLNQPNTILVDINTSDENKRTAYSITQNQDKSLQVVKYEPVPGVELPDYIEHVNKIHEMTQ